MVRDMMSERDISQTFWMEVVHTVVHILNKAHLRPNSDKTPYELWFGRPTSIKHFKVFGSKCYMLGPRYDHFYDGYYTLLPHVHMCFSSFKGAF
jgi:hypothetical protein